MPRRFYVRIAFCLVVAWAAVCAAQVGDSRKASPGDGVPAAVGKPTEATGGFSGIVLCDDTHRPARGASVRLSRQHGAEDDKERHYAMTDADGRFAFAHLPATEYSVSVHLAGYLFPQPPEPLAVHAKEDKEEQEQPAPVVAVHAGEHVTRELTIIRGASFAGHVAYADGSPAIRADLRLEDLRPRPEDPQHPGQPKYRLDWRLTWLAVTDDHGDFRVAGVSPGTYRIAAVPTLSEYHLSNQFGLDYDGSEALDQPKDLTVFSGDTLHRGQAKTYRVRAGDEVTGITITIPLDNRHTVAGTTSTAGGLSPTVGTVTLVDHADPEVQFRTVVQKDGSFAFANIPSGTYTLTVEHAFVIEPDRTTADNDGDADDVATHAFARVESGVMVKDADVEDLHVTLVEGKLPPKPKD